MLVNFGRDVTRRACYQTVIFILPLNALGSAALCVYVMFLNISERLTANYSIAHKVLPTASPIYFHQKSTILVCVLENIVMPFPYAQTTFVNAPLFPVVVSVFCDQCLCIVSPIVQHLRCHLFINKEISTSLHYLGKHELRKLCLFSHAGRQRSRRSGAMLRFFALLSAQSRSFCKLTGEATVNTFSTEKKTKSTACSESIVFIETRYRA